jgi:hypothetical protein
VERKSHNLIIDYVRKEKKEGKPRGNEKKFLKVYI